MKERKFNDLVLFHKILHQPTQFLCFPEYLHKKHLPEYQTTRYTRSMTSSDDLQFDCTIKPRIDVFKNAYFYRTSILWNNIPHVIRSESSPVVFKKKLKELMCCCTDVRDVSLTAKYIISFHLL